MIISKSLSKLSFTRYFIQYVCWIAPWFLFLCIICVGHYNGTAVVDDEEFILSFTFHCQNVFGWKLKETESFFCKCFCYVLNNAYCKLLIIRSLCISRVNDKVQFWKTIFAKIVWTCRGEAKKHNICGRKISQMKFNLQNPQNILPVKCKFFTVLCLHNMHILLIVMKYSAGSLENKNDFEWIVWQIYCRQ